MPKGPMLICRGIANKLKLRCSGVRNWLGQTLNYRNNEWVNGTMPGLCVAFAGSNSDVKPNDRLPIMPETHEQCCRKKSCLVKKNHLKRTTLITQRTQSLTNGYFGGYIGKRQPAASMETRKCVGKLSRLRAKMQGKTQAAQLRAASGRLVSEIEMNSTFRGAVEVFNLARNLHARDVLFAECIRSFTSVTIDGQSWVHRFLTSQHDKKLEQSSLETYVPPTRKPNVRTDRVRANDFEVYGFRPQVQPWKYLSVYEFLRYWQAEPLLTPTYYENRKIRPRTKWTEEGFKLKKSTEYKREKVKAKPGVHYEAVDKDAGSDEYFLFPSYPADIYRYLRHTWVLVRKKRPDVVVIENLRLPSPARSNAENAQYCLLFFRPWTLLAGDTRVPNLTLLGCAADHLKSIYSNDVEEPRNKQPHVGHKKQSPSGLQATNSQRISINAHQAWEEYVRGGIVSQAAAKLIQSFLLKTLAASGGGDADKEDSDADASDDDPDLPRLKLPAQALGGLLEPQFGEAEGTPEATQSMGTKLLSSQKRNLRQIEYERSISIGRSVWKTADLSSAADDRDSPGHMFADTYHEHVQALRACKTTDQQRSAPFDEERHAAATWEGKNASHTLNSVFQAIQTEKLRPNEAQRTFLEHFVRRLHVEILESRQRSTSTTECEPMLDLIHGFAGTGKSLVIGWMRRLMEEGLGWKHGVQFICLAFQNAMAAHINGNTIHHWSGIPARQGEGTGSGDKQAQSIKCQALRVIIIDEISMVSAELLGTLESVVRQAVRVHGTYKKRPDGSTRAFGGVNLIMCGDFWQLQPVGGTFLADNPLDACGLAEKAGDASFLGSVPRQHPQFLGPNGSDAMQGPLV